MIPGLKLRRSGAEGRELYRHAGQNNSTLFGASVDGGRYRAVEYQFVVWANGSLFHTLMAFYCLGENAVQAVGKRLAIGL